MKNKATIMGLIIKMSETEDSFTRVFIADRIFDLLNECEHTKTTRVSSDVPDYYQCVQCNKQFSESEIA